MASSERWLGGAETMGGDGDGLFAKEGEQFDVAGGDDPELLGQAVPGGQVLEADRHGKRESPPPAIANWTPDARTATAA